MSEVPIKRPEDVVVRFVEAWNHFNDCRLQATDVRVKRLSDEIAVVHALMTFAGQTSVGEIAAPLPRSNLMSFVVHQTRAGWRCASAHNTDIVPGSGTDVIDDQGRLRSVSYRDKR